LILPIPVENTPPSKGGTFVPSLGACDKLRNSESIPHATLGKKRAVFLFSMQDNLIRTDVTVIGGGLTLQPLRKPILGEVLAPFIQAIFWRIAMHRALRGEVDGDQIVDDFHAPFSGFAGPWQFMRVMRWGQPEQLLANVPTFLPELLMPTLIFHGSRDAAIPEAFARRATSLIPNSSMVTLASGHFIPLHQAELVATRLAGCFAS